MESFLISFHIDTQTDPKLLEACEPITCLNQRYDVGDEINANDKATQTEESSYTYNRRSKKRPVQNGFRVNYKTNNKQEGKLTFENIQLEDLYKKDNTETLKDVGAFVAKTAIISGGVIGGISLALPAIGFTSAGVAAGSLAAAYQSTLGGTVAAGSAFAVCQSVGAAGFAASTQAAIVAGSGALVSAHSTVCNFIRKKLW